MMQPRQDRDRVPVQDYKWDYDRSRILLEKVRRLELLLVIFQVLCGGAFIWLLWEVLR